MTGLCETAVVRVDGDTGESREIDLATLMRELQLEEADIQTAFEALAEVGEALGLAAAYQLLEQGDANEALVRAA